MNKQQSRTPRVRTLGLLVALAAALPALASPAHGDEKADCLQAYDQAQRLRKHEHLRAARDQLLICARRTCPPAVRPDCTLWAEEVEQSMPTVVFAATRPDGQEIVDVRVRMDGEPMAERLDGHEISADPGMHTFRFETVGAPIVEQRLVIRVGEKHRKVSVVLSSPNAAPSLQPTSLPGAEPRRPIPTSVYILGGLGLVGLGAYTYFGLRFDSQVSDL